MVSANHDRLVPDLARTSVILGTRRLPSRGAGHGSGRVFCMAHKDANLASRTAVFISEVSVIPSGSALKAVALFFAVRYLYLKASEETETYRNTKGHKSILDEKKGSH